jgi:histidine kinase
MAVPSYARFLFKRLIHSLSLKLGLSVGLVVFLAILGFAYFFLKTQEAQALQKILGTASMFSDTLKKSTKYSMLKYQPEAVLKTIEAAGEQTGVERIRIFNKKGTIMYSTLSREIGQTVNLQAEACFSCHQENKPLERISVGARSRIFSAKDGERVMGQVNPIYNEESCSTADCHAHPPDRTILGVLDVILSLKDVDREKERNTRNILVFALLFLLGASGLVGFFIFYFVNRPINQLRQRTREIASGQYDRPIPVLSTDEMGELSGSFEEMRQKILETTTALQKSREQFQTLFESVPCYISVQDRHFNLLQTNRAFQRDFDGSAGPHCYEVYKQRPDKCPNCSVEKTFLTGAVYTNEEIVTTKDGNQAHVLIHTAPIYNENKEISMVMEMSTNITALKILEEELIKSEEAYRLLFNNDPSPIFVVKRADFQILDANVRALDLYGYDKVELTQKSFYDLVPGEAREELRVFFQGSKTFLGKLKQVSRSGASFYVNLRCSEGSYRDFPVYILTTNDITERVQAEEQLMQASKMATLGEMSAGIAHELNQPLTVIKTGSGFLLRKLKQGQPLSETMLLEIAEEMDAQVDRASRIINHLREFGRKTDLRLVPTPVNEAIAGMMTVLGKQLSLRRIKVIVDLDPELPAILADKNRLEQIFINLAMNARDALEEISRPEKTITVQTRYRDGWVEVRFADNGCGIPAELQGKIFEPFFSTKGVGRGTGLGLSISYGIIRDYQGEIRVESRPGEGTTFILLFPPSREEGGASG